MYINLQHTFIKHHVTKKEKKQKIHYLNEMFEDNGPKKGVSLSW